MSLEILFQYYNRDICLFLYRTVSLSLSLTYTHTHTLFSFASISISFDIINISPSVFIFRHFFHFALYSIRTHIFIRFSVYLFPHPFSFLLFLYLPRALFYLMWHGYDYFESFFANALWILMLLKVLFWVSILWNKYQYIPQKLVLRHFVNSILAERLKLFQWVERRK